PDTASSGVGIGARGDGGATFYGALDEFSVWNRVIDANENDELWTAQRTQPTMEIATLTVNEGDSAELVVTLSAAADWPVIFDWSTGDAGDTADAGSDYTSASGTFTISAGTTVATLPAITTINDGPGDDGEYFTVSLS